MSNKIHFKGLNGIRAIASLIVLIFHIDQFLPMFGLASLGFYETGMAGYGVTLFFVLSGFLITRLLLIEKETCDRIDLPKFYIRRILRIWPIYYLVILFAVIIYLTVPHLITYPEGKVFITFALYSGLLANFALGLGLNITPIAPLWSVGVEEQFYVFWPLLLRKSKKLLKTLLIIIIIYLAIKSSMYFLGKDRLYRLVSLCRFDCMAIGGIGAYLVHNKSKYLNFLYMPVIQAISWAILAVSVFYKPVHLFTLINDEFHAIVYLLIIMNVSNNSRSLMKLDNKFFDFIGRISYGIYVYHVTVIIVLSLVFNQLFHFQATGSAVNYLLVFSSIVITTMAISYISYNYFETYFLKLKTKFSVIESDAKGS